MKESHWIAIAAVVAAAIVIGLWWIDRGQTPFSNPIDYVLLGVAAVMSIIAVFGNALFKRSLSRTGRSSGDERGPEPGDGAVIHHSSGEADFDGLPGNVPPPIKDTDRDLPYPHKKAAD